MRRRIAFAAVISVIGLCSMPAWAQRTSNIRNVDFLNFTYTSTCLSEGENFGVKVTNGVFKSTSEDSVGFFEVLDVEYGDLTGDSKEEAVVLTRCSMGGSGTLSWGYIFTLSNGTPKLLVEVEGGDRALGAINRVKISNRLIEVVRNDGGNMGQCCPEFIKTERFRLRRNRLILQGESERSRIPPDPQAEKIQFGRGRTTATLKGSAVGEDRYIIGAQANQNLIVHLSSERNNATLQILNTDGQSLGSAINNSFSGLLPRTGDYKIIIRSTGGIANYVLEITIPPLR